MPLGTIGCPWGLLGDPRSDSGPRLGTLFGRHFVFVWAHVLFTKIRASCLKVVGVFSPSFWSGLGPETSSKEGNETESVRKRVREAKISRGRCSDDLGRFWGEANKLEDGFMTFF